MLTPDERTLKRREQRKRQKRRAKAPKRGFSLENINELMKRLYLPAIRESLNNSTVLMKHLKG